MEVCSGSHKTIQLNLWQIYFFSFKVHLYENISPVRHVYEFRIFLRWDSALHFKFAQNSFNNSLFDLFPMSKYSLSWALLSGLCEMLLCICLLCATTHLSNLEIHQVLPHLPLGSIHGLFIQTQKCLHTILLQDLGIIYRGLVSLNSLIFEGGNPL